MGTICESSDPDMKFPSSLLFGSDFLLESGVLLDDFCETVIIREGSVVRHFSYDEWKYDRCFIPLN